MSQHIEEHRVPTSEQVVNRSYTRGAVEFLGGIGLITVGIAIGDSAAAYLIAGGIVSTTFGYTDLAHPIG